MNKLARIRRWRLRPLLLLGLFSLLFGLLASPKAALAHPLDVYLQATYITVAPTEIEVELDLTPGVLVAPEALPQMDTDGDEQISDAEGRAYVEAMLENVVLQLDGEPLTLTIMEIDMPTYLNVQAGYGTIRIFTTATLTAGMTGTHQLEYANNFAPTGAAYQVNAFVDRDVAIKLGKQNRDSIQQTLTVDYTIDSTESATDETATDIAAAENVAATDGMTATATATTSTAMTETASLVTPFDMPTSTSGQAQRLLAYLYDPTASLWVLLLGLGLATVLGGLHALTPGHGKTLVAAYLVGSRGTVRHAIALGGIVTFTHTASVILIGLLALFASQYIVPDVLMPVLEISAGLLVVFLGVRLVWQRWSAFRHSGSHNHEHSHDHDHAHVHEHDHGHTHTYTHDHGDGHVHSHLPTEERITLGSLLTMGVSGGLVPCPEALGIMVIAIGLNRILLGLGLIVSFSFGLAAVLIIIGVLLVRSRSLVERFGGLSNRWSNALPLASAVIVTVLGLGITFSGLVTYLG